MATYKKLDVGVVLRWYKRPDVQNAIIGAAFDKEIAVSYGGTGYGKRPDVLQYPNDVLSFVMGHATSFHCSEELWRNPLQITTGMPVSEINELRKGWDLILDIDCAEFEFSRWGAFFLVEALKHYGVKSIGVKFSGNHGFHIGVPFAAFPEFIGNKETKTLFPEGPRRIAALLQEKIRVLLGKKLLELFSLQDICSRVGKDVSQVVKNNQFDPFAVLSIDTVLIANRHLYRMPYSLNEKSGFVSVVIPADDIVSFQKESASPERVSRFLPFLPDAIPGEGKRLLVEAMDFNPVIEDKYAESESAPKEFASFDAIPEEFFPPCIQLISQGLKDGKKRALFVLLNFFSTINWPYEKVDAYIKAWNKRNPEPLRDVLVLGHLRYFKSSKKKVLPPNCDNKAYMADLGVCKPDGFCRRIKNPAQYAIRKQQAYAREAENNSKGKQKEQKTNLSSENKINSEDDSQSNNNESQTTNNKP